MAKKSRRRVPKEDRKNKRLWAEGAHETVLFPHIEPYTDALERNWREERAYLQNVCNEFHGRISWRLEDHEEPELPLPEYDPRAPAIYEALDEEETKRKRERLELLNAVSVGVTAARDRDIELTLRDSVSDAG